MTLAIYRLTRLLPPEEPIGWQIRKLANEIIGDLALENFKIAQKRIGLIRLFFETAKTQDWVKSLNWEMLEKEYQDLLTETVFLELKGEGEEKKEKNPIRPEKRRKKSKSFDEFELRKKNILEEFKKKKKLKISEIKSLFPGKISERTLRNDLQKLIDKKIISKEGSTHSAIYFLK